MSEIRVAAEKHVNAPANSVYQYIADFQNHHAHFLPDNFSNVRVEEGGVGSGTVVSFLLKVGSRERAYRMRVEEPEAGRVLTEFDTTSSAVTRFTVDPAGDGSLVRIETTWQGAGGIGGFFERTFAPPMLRKVYRDELQRLDEYASGLKGDGAGA